MPKDKNEATPIVQMVDADGNARDFWPVLPSREDCVAARYPTDFESLQTLQAVWPALTVAEKELLGFSRMARAMQIERLILTVREKQKGQTP